MLTRRGALLGVALAATIGASLFDLPSSEPVPSAKANAATVVSAAPAPRKAPEAVERPSLRERYESQAADLFAPRSWQPPPPPPKAEAPKAPPLPFRYLGKMQEEGMIMVFLGQGARTYLLRAGDLLADYRVEKITPQKIIFVYLPLNEKQRLTFGSAN